MKENESSTERRKIIDSSESISDFNAFSVEQER